MYLRLAMCLIFLILSVTTLFIHAPIYSPTSLHLSNQSQQQQDCSPNVTPTPTSTPTSQTNHIVINEILLSPRNPPYHCSEVSQEISPWIELYNPYHQSVSLADTYITIQHSDSPLTMPAGTTIPSQGFIVLFSTSTTLPTNVSTLIRLVINGQLIDQVTVPPLAIDTSYARIPDGGPWYITTSPTIESGNKLTTIVTRQPTAKPTHTPTNHPKTSAKKQATPLQTQPYPTSSVKTTSSPPPVIPTILPQQPQWKILHMYDVARTNTTADPTIQAVPPSAVSNIQTNAHIDTPRKILITAFLLALLLSIWWNIRLFFLIR